MLKFYSGAKSFGHRYRQMVVQLTKKRRLFVTIFLRMIFYFIYILVHNHTSDPVRTETMPWLLHYVYN